MPCVTVAPRTTQHIEGLRQSFLDAGFDALGWRRQVVRQLDRSGAMDQGEPGRTLAAACPSQTLTPPDLEPVQQDSDRWSAVKAEFYQAQDGHCAICLRSVSLEESQLDHCHQTGFIRGVLCISCNTKLGFYETRRHAIETYLARAAEFAAHIVPSALPRQPKPKQARNEHLRRHWQSKVLD